MLTTLLASIALTLPTMPMMHAQDAAKPAAKADAKPERLVPGMAAPKLEVKEFIKGTAIDGFKPGQVYVVEFWATWCGPCIRAFPHLSELQEQYGDKVTIIGVNIWERPYDDGTLAKVVAGEWNPGEAKKLADAEAKEAETARALQKASRDLLKARVAARESGDWSEWSKTIDGLIESTKGSPSQMQFRMMKFQTLIGEANMPEKGYALGEELITEGKDDAQLLNAIAWFAVQDDSVMKRNLDFCLKAAQAANDADKGQDGAILDTLARVHWERGENAKAIELQEKAVSLSKDTPMAKEMQETLETYKKGK